MFGFGNTDNKIKGTKGIGYTECEKNEFEWGFIFQCQVVIKDKVASMWLS